MHLASFTTLPVPAEGAADASAATERMHDLDDITIRKDAIGMTASRHDFAIHLDRHPALGQTLGSEQVGKGASSGEGEAFAVQSDIHPRIVARGWRPAQHG